MFAKYHYLNTKLHKAAKSFAMTIDNELCGFISYLPFPHPIAKNLWRGHRLVVKPDYQGIGLGHYLSCWLGNHLKSIGKILISTTSNPAIIQSRKKDSRWVTTRYGRVNDALRGAVQSKINSRSRLTASFKYVG